MGDYCATWERPHATRPPGMVYLLNPALRGSLAVISSSMSISTAEAPRCRRSGSSRPLLLENFVSQQVGLDRLTHTCAAKECGEQVISAVGGQQATHQGPPTQSRSFAAAYF